MSTDSGLQPQPDLGPQPQPYVWDPFDEIRAGVFAHNWIHDEAAPVDLSFEALSAPIAFPGYNNPSIAGNPWISWFFQPRLDVGAMINTRGRSSYAFTGFNWRIPIIGKFFFEGEFGGAVNNAPNWPERGRVDMGCALTFRESGGFGYQFSENWDVIASIEHVSHATFCTHINPGLTQVGARIGYKF
ncbi:acyloxyacyl hydrolase [Roseiarcus sp.]|uniref:acyloxyacyl hydrolase n=1 Tax=Roseiarcus sp. TaxID=1969460 RepID=UPI003F9572A8